MLKMYPLTLEKPLSSAGGSKKKKVSYLNHIEWSQVNLTSTHVLVMLLLQDTPPRAKCAKHGRPFSIVHHTHDRIIMKFSPSDFFVTSGLIPDSVCVIRLSIKALLLARRSSESGLKRLEGEEFKKWLSLSAMFDWIDTMLVTSVAKVTNPVRRATATFPI